MRRSACCAATAASGCYVRRRQVDIVRNCTAAVGHMSRRRAGDEPGELSWMAARQGTEHPGACAVRRWWPAWGRCWVLLWAGRWQMQRDSGAAFAATVPTVVPRLAVVLLQLCPADCAPAQAAVATRMVCCRGRLCCRAGRGPFITFVCDLPCRAPFFLSAAAAAVAAAVAAFALPETACGRAAAEAQQGLQRQQQYRGHDRPYWQQAGEQPQPEGRQDSGSRLLPLLQRETADVSAAVPGSDGSSSSLAADNSRQHVADMVAATAAPSASAQHSATAPAAPPAQGWDAADVGAAGGQPRRGQGQRWLPRVPAGWLAILSSVDFCAIALVGSQPAYCSTL